MKTFMLKSTTGLLALALGFGALAQDQEPEDDTPSPAELLRRLLPQNGETNGLTEETLAELLRSALEARQTNSEERVEGQRPEPERGPRPIRGQGTRGTMGSSTNALPLTALLDGPSAEPGANASGKGLRLNFRNAPLHLVLDYLSDAAGLVISANSKVDLKGAVTVWSNQMVDRTEAIRLLNAALTSSGYAATVEGNLLNIYVVDATTTPIEVGIPDNDYANIPPTKDLVTQIVYVRNVEANQLIQSLTPLMPTGTSMSANQGANAILITDTRANIRRMAQLVKALDTASVSATEVRVFPLIYADATALAQAVTQLFQTDSTANTRNRGGFPGMPGFGGFPGGDRGRGDAGSGAQAGRVAAPRVTAVADERSNSLVVAGSVEQLEAVRLLVDQIDVNVDDITELRVFRLRNADPQETADQLASLFPDPSTQQGSRNQQGGFRGFGPFGGGQVRTASTTDPNSRNLKQTRVTAVADPRTGSVIVSASRDLMIEIAGIIEELDSDPARKKRVYVIPVENRDPQEVVQGLQSVIATDSSANLNTRNTANQSGSQLNTRQQNNLQNQRNTGGQFNSGFGGTGTRTGR